MKHYFSLLSFILISFGLNPIDAISASGDNDFFASSGTYSAIGKFEECERVNQNLRFNSSDSLQEKYQLAIKDAEIADPSEICKNLTPVVSYNSSLVRENDNGKEFVLFSTWTSYTGYDSIVGTTTTLSRDVWVNVVPEIQNFCTLNEITETSLTLRLEQLLGVPPNIGKTRMVEIFAEPEDVFRPAPDPEITDCEAELNFPEPSDYISVSETYKKWYNDLAAVSYLSNGYPWTRLGYTYDWGNPYTDIGLTEYVIRKGAVVKIKAVELTADYCLHYKAKNSNWVLY